MKTIPDSIESLRAFLAKHPEHRPGIPNGPGLGLGGRMGKIASTSAMLAIEELPIEASAVQCSVFRELRPDFVNADNTFVEYKGIGQIPVGHTGMTIKGQFLEAVLDRIDKNITARYAADADHIPLKGDSTEEIAELRKFIEEAQDRTFFTVDPHFCMDHTAMAVEDKFGRLLDAFESAVAVIDEIKGSSPYVIELSIDECPGVTSVAEMEFLVQHLSRKNIPLFSIAPAIGFTKKDEDNLELRTYLQRVLPELNRIARDHGLVLGIHSGDGKSDETRRIIGEATEGNVWYKVSPDRQRIFFQVLADSSEGSNERILFEEMFQSLLKMVQEGASSNKKDFAVNCRESLAELKERHLSRPTADCQMFHDFGFLSVQKFKDPLGSVGADFTKRYYEADFRYIKNLAESLGIIR